MGFLISVPDQQEPALAAVSLILFAVSVGLNIIAGYLLKEKEQKEPQNDKPTVLSTRGSYIPVAIGSHELGYFFAGAWDRAPAANSKFTESGWHILGVGPMFELSKITQNGEEIFNGLITRTSHPSGTTVQLPDTNDGQFTIYWGESNQPQNTFLAGIDSASPTKEPRVGPRDTRLPLTDLTPGIKSRWPAVAYIVWENKLIDAGNRWPRLEYTCAFKPNDSGRNEAGIRPGLTQSASWQERTFSRNLTNNLDQMQNGSVWVSGKGSDAGGDYFYVTDHYIMQATPKDSDLNQILDSQQPIDIRWGVAQANTNRFTIKSISYQAGRTVWYGTAAPFLWLNAGTKIYVNESHAAVTIAPLTYISFGDTYFSDDNEGANPAHIIHQVLVQPWPFGAGMGDFASDDADIDLDALEAIGVSLSAQTGQEDLRGNILAKDGRTYARLLAMVMQDMGIMLRQDPISEKLQAVLVRRPSGNLPYLHGDVLVGAPPELEVVHQGNQVATELVFIFLDRANGFRESTLAIDDMGATFLATLQKPKTVRMDSVRDMQTASIVAERRAQEELGGTAGIKIQANHSAGYLLPGQAFTVADIPDVLRCVSSQIRPDSSVVVIEALFDFYGVPASGFQHLPPIPKKLTSFIPYADELADMVQFTALDPLAVGINGNSPDITFWPVRVPSIPQTQKAGLHISEDDLVYSRLKTLGDGFLSRDLSWGGSLDSAMPATGPWVISIYLIATLAGPDQGSIPDLTDFPASWRSGRVRCLIEDEMFYLQDLEALPVSGTNPLGDKYYLKGLIRAREGTTVASHPAGSQVLLWDTGSLSRYSDPTRIQEGKTTYFKITPSTFREMTVEQVPTITKVKVSDPYKEAIPVSAIRGSGASTGATTYSWKAGDDLSFQWDYGTHSASKAAGSVPAGDPITAPPPLGSFVINFSTDASPSIVKKTFGDTPTALVTSPSLSVTNADLVSWFGSEPSTFILTITEIFGARNSAPSQIRMTKV